MEKTAKLLVTDTYYNAFNILKEVIAKKGCPFKRKTLVFCEEKISLMTERYICSVLGGTFDVDVFSFGKYLRKTSPVQNVLSKEGSAMAVKRVLNGASLQCFSQSKQNLAPTVYDLIMQLKSAKITPQAILSDQLPDGVLKNKLCDISLIYGGYERFIKENAFHDQSSVLDVLTESIKKDLTIKDKNVILLGYTGFTRQAREIITALLNGANDVTAILTAGDNARVYLNETAVAFKELCALSKIKVEERVFETQKNLECQIIRDKMFTPNAYSAKKFTTDKISLYTAKNFDDEINWLATSIKKSVMSGELRYSDISVAVSDVNKVADGIERFFNLLQIPYFIDQKRKTENHPLISLITAYVDAFRRGLDRNELKAFYKNPLFCDDKRLADNFENYLRKYNINYSRLNLPFTLFDNARENAVELENFRQKVIKYFTVFDIRQTLSDLNVKDKLQTLGEKLKDMGENELKAVNEQVYDAVVSILDQMDMLLGDEKLSLYEYKNVFLSGVNALELSIIPQYVDAVFIGGYREVALAPAKHLYMIGLDSSAPAVKEDVALLSDGDINKLERLKVMVEPKIKVVNDRVRENAGLATMAFTQKLFLSFTAFGDAGKANVKSEIVTCLENLFTVNKAVKPNLKELDGYLTERQALLSFASELGKFTTGEIDELNNATSYYSLKQLDQTVLSVLEGSQKQVKIRLDREERSVINKVVSPTTIEEFYHCPYRAFVNHTLKVKPIEDGTVSPLAVGNVMHAIFELYVKRIDQVTDQVSHEKVFDECVRIVLEDQNYKKFALSNDTAYALDSIIKESKLYCEKIYKHFKNSNFKPYKVEAVFGVGKECDFPPITLTDKVKLTGKIDRLDSYKGYYRVIDYKTGKSDATDKSLFAGLKLQLYLYASVVKDKTLAGVYYMPIDDSFRQDDKEKGALTVGKTLDNEEAVFAQDRSLEIEGVSEFFDVSVGKTKLKKTTSEEGLCAYAEYAFLISRKGAEQMTDGVIVASPFDGECGYCKYKGLCGGALEPRKLQSVSQTIIEDAVKGGE